MRSIELPDIDCFIHSVSPVKRSYGSEYMNCDIQTESSVVKAVCFSPEKRKTLQAMAQQKTPVKIKKYNISTKFGREDVVIDRKTCLIPTTVAFQYQGVETSSSNITSLSQVAPDQLVAVKARVKHLSSPKNVVLVGGDPVRKQECYVCDPSGFMMLILWGEYTDSVEEDKTYFFNKARVRVTSLERYLNTPKE